MVSLLPTGLLLGLRRIWSVIGLPSIFDWAKMMSWVGFRFSEVGDKELPSALTDVLEFFSVKRMFPQVYTEPQRLVN